MTFYANHSQKIIDQPLHVTAIASVLHFCIHIVTFAFVSEAVSMLDAPLPRLLIMLIKKSQEILAFVFSAHSLETVLCHNPSGTGEGRRLATSSLVLDCAACSHKRTFLLCLKYR